MNPTQGFDIVTDAAQTFPKLIRTSARLYGESPAISLTSATGDTHSVSFVELDSRSAELARGLIARGVGKGSRVGFIYGNGPEFAVAFAAIARAGGIAVPISTLAKAHELVRILRQSDISGLLLQRSLLGKDYVQRLCDALPALVTATTPDLRLQQVPFLRWVVSTGPDLPVSIRDQQWLLSAAKSVSDELLREVESEVHSTDQVLEIYTSGSMAMPKGVKHCHGPMLQRTQYLCRMRPLPPGAEIMVGLPMFWVGGMMLFLLANWTAGAKTVCSEGTSTNSKIAMGSVLAKDDMFELPEGMTIWALGMTETLGPYSYADEMRAPGYPLCPPLDHIADGFEVRVADEDGKPVADGAVGEIQVRGYALTPGLHKMERDAYFTVDGYYHTGDLGQRDGKRIHFVGRDGDMIKTANSNVSPAEVEYELQQLDGIHSAYVVGIPDRERGQLLVAAVVPRDDAELDFADIQAQLTENLSSYKVPRAYVAISRDEVPMLPSNKVARRQIEAMMIEKLNR
ncbi:acyl--CoA ligase [Aestuariicella hydrocarbonica]|uniref:Acyl--CoA ligase n=1 Tax=Pseudomaricurvus hydrocarbonicus TaxID=1470433 RepID=A0A9E5MLY3_9GAMM|nr:class I adenylate-forming enzyme family protein [Aestuariicella hydrocarbonica]NHO65783.1 acyl--CoA ligase [Aestuariicella hydrocarbonica]